MSLHNKIRLFLISSTCILSYYLLVGFICVNCLNTDCSNWHLKIHSEVKCNIISGIGIIKMYSTQLPPGLKLKNKAIQGSPTVLGNYQVVLSAMLVNQHIARITLDISVYQKNEIFYYTQFSSFSLIPNQYYYIPLITDVPVIKPKSFILKQIPYNLNFDSTNGMISGKIITPIGYFQSELYYSDYFDYYLNTSIMFNNLMNKNENINKGIFVNYIEIDRNNHKCDEIMNITELKIINQDILNEMKEEKENCLYASYYEFYIEMKKSKTINFRLSSYGNSVMYLDEYENKILSTRSCDYNYEKKEMELDIGKHYIRIEYFPSTYKYEIKLEISNDNGITYEVLNKENCIIYDGVISNVKYEELYINPNSFILLKPEILSGNIIKYENQSVIPNGLNLNSANGIMSGILEECIENIEITVECIGNSNSIKTKIIIHCYSELESDYSMEIRRIQNDIYDKTLKLNSFIHNPIIFESISMKNHFIPFNEINVNLSNSSYIITYNGIIDKETINKMNRINIEGNYKRIKMIIRNEKEYIYDNNIKKELFTNLPINIKSEYHNYVKIIINVDNIKDYQSISMKVNEDINILSLLKRVSISSFYYPSKYLTFYLLNNISPIVNKKISKSMNNPFKYKINPSLPDNIHFNETTGRINVHDNYYKNMYDYTEFTIIMYNDKISYYYSIYLRYFDPFATIINLNEDFVMRNDRLYYPVEIEGIFTSFNISNTTDSIKIVNGYVLSGYLNMIDLIYFRVEYFDIGYSEYMTLNNYGVCKAGIFLVVLVDILDYETNIEIGIYNFKKDLIIEQNFNHSYVSMYYCLYEGIYYLTYKILNYDSEKIYDNTITYGFANDVIMNEIDASNSSETYQFNIPYTNMQIWYDEIRFTDESDKYIDLYPKTNNPYTYELNKDKYRWRCGELPDNLNFNHSTGRMYGNISYKDTGIMIVLFYEDEVINRFVFKPSAYSYYCIYPHLNSQSGIFTNETINCENGYYGNRLTKCIYEEDSDDTKWEIIDINNCKEVKTKPSNENEALVIMSLTIHLEEIYLLFEYKPSVWINSNIIRELTYIKVDYDLNIDEVSILSNEKDLESGNITIIIQYTTIKKEIEETINKIKSIYCVERTSDSTEFVYFFKTNPFYLSYIEVIQHHKSSDLYLYIGIFGGIVVFMIVVCAIRVICKYIINKNYKEKIIQMI